MPRLPPRISPPADEMSRRTHTDSGHAELDHGAPIGAHVGVAEYRNLCSVKLSRRPSAATRRSSLPRTAVIRRGPSGAGPIYRSVKYGCHDPSAVSLDFLISIAPSRGRPDID